MQINNQIRVLRLYIMILPAPFTWLRREYLENSGITQQEYPTLFLILYENFIPFMTMVAAMLFFWIISTTPARLFKYQVKRIGFCLMTNAYLSFASAGQLFCNIQGGRIWTCFPLFSATCNDIFAYVAGRMFGKRKLIGLSPNKTLEGFIGGLISNVIFTMIVVDWITTSPFWTCQAARINTLPFENY